MEVELDSQEPRRYQEEGGGAELSRTQEGSRAGWCSWALKNLGEIESGEVEGGVWMDVLIFLLRSSSATVASRAVSS